MKYILLCLGLINIAHASTFVSKLKAETKGYDLKVAHEAAMTKIAKSGVTELLGFEEDTNMECVNWVYLGPSSREEAIAVCRGVDSIECAQFVYQGPSSRVESIEACRGVYDMECVRYVYQGPASRVEAARTCANGGGRPRPPRPPHNDDDCHP